MAFNEDTRVKIPAILALCRLGYKYISLKDNFWDLTSNIFTEIFTSSIKRLNNWDDDEKVTKLLDDISLDLDGEDLGKKFYNRLTSSTPKLIDFNNIKNNDFHVVTELPYINDDDEFRPDITLLINGMPLAFLEVKKPNNKDGILAERDRINVRFKNKKFRKFINISQVLGFSNNMEYDEDSTVPLMGAFYSTTSYNKANFNCFREELQDELCSLLSEENEEIENFVLSDNNKIVIKNNPEFITNKEPNTPTNRLILSLFSQERLLTFIRYGIAYVDETDGIEKHIMRYPQYFASRAIQDKLDADIRKGIIWHTQGSGKTALAYFNIKWLTDYFHSKGIVPKFYFIVDRIDLLDQANVAFSNRGLNVCIAKSRKTFAESLTSQSIIEKSDGKPEITLVNIQKFDEATQAQESEYYDIKMQRIYFIDEAHRSYSLQGSFLLNLINSDRDAIFLSLTGTPLIKKDLKSKDIFGNYIHKYFYNLSIADGYTLRLIREAIETKYKITLNEALKQIEVKHGTISREEIYSHNTFVEPMLKYIVEDLEKSRLIFDDNTIGGMVVCDSSAQAKMMQKLFDEQYATDREGKNIVRKSALILHDIGDKESRKEEKKQFVKYKTIDILFVYNMLLTGFDAPRLKKLYIGRKIGQDHSLLQTLTRVNRPYNEFRYGYVVDFADIKKAFDDANQAYWEELNSELGNETENYSNIFKSADEINEEIRMIKEALWQFDTLNAENFSRQISEIQDKAKVLEIKKSLKRANELYNLIRYSQYTELLGKLDFGKLKLLLAEIERHLAMLNKKDDIENGDDISNLLNIALEDIYFMFKKIGEEELKIADELRTIMRKTREGLVNNFDHQDPKWVKLKEELEILFKKKNLDEITQAEMHDSIIEYNRIYDKIKELNRLNNLLKDKYKGDEKFVRVHKRIVEAGSISQVESAINEALLQIKATTDNKVLLMKNVLNNEPFFKNMVQPEVIEHFKNGKIKLNTDGAKFINNCIVREYIREYNGVSTW